MINRQNYNQTESSTKGDEVVDHIKTLFLKDGYAEVFFTLVIFISQWISHCSAIAGGVIRMKFVFRIKRRST